MQTDVMPCWFCGADVPHETYGRSECPKCGQVYEYDEKQFPVLTPAQCQLLRQQPAGLADDAGEWQTTPGGAHQLLLVVDDADRRSIEQAIEKRAAGIMPDQLHDDANEAGQVLAEICRGWIERCEAMDGLRAELDRLSHIRRCRDCGNIGRHVDNVAPYVKCPKCGSMDTRPLKTQEGGAA